jgi:predicted acylesterase/phospholipase RssA/molybdopterin/thiamine biosynthesis adenylyltransferase/proteasome lid subunit RPN8/RPN11
MTEGHQLAVDQLRAIQDNAKGAFEVVEIAEEPNAADLLHIDVTLDCSGKRYVEGGVHLKRRERFTISIPADFPYQLPAVVTPHTRFAGLPHIQWKRQLCLYQAPATEWNVNDGMFGYISRLDIWLDHAAAGELNPSGEALHPPIAYPSSGPLRLVIPRTDTPPVSNDNWIGFAELATVSDTRADIAGWKPLSSLEINPPFAPAFLMSEAMPYEFPRKMGDLFSELERRGVSVSLLIAALRIAVLLNQETDPLFVVLGTPMRGIAGSEERRFHLAAWHVDPLTVRGLRLSLHKFDPNPRLQQIGEEVEQLVMEWLKSADVEWCLVREERPEIVVPRDRDSAMAWFKGKAVSVWGCGALGSHVAEFLTRAGVRRLVLRDSGIVTPGIIARQLFSDADIGKSKVSALSARLRAIRSGIEIEERLGDLLSGALAADDWTDLSDVVIETTASAAVMNKTEGVRRRNGAKCPFVSMALGHTAQNAMLLIATPDYSGGPLDIDRKLRQECSRRRELREFEEEFWPREPRTEIFQPEPGCSDPTFIGSCADVAGLAATMMNLLAQELTARTAPAVAHFLAQPAKLQSNSWTHKRFFWPADQVLDEPSSGYEVRLSVPAWSEMTGWIAANDRTRGARVETGGLIFGERNELLKIIWVDDVSGPPPDSSHSASGFICGIQGTAKLASEKADRTMGSTRFLGMWHTHPDGAPVPSPTDLQGVEQLIQTTGTPRSRSLMLIVGGGADTRFSIAPYLFSREDFDLIRAAGQSRECSIHVLPGQRPIRNVGLALSGGGSRAIAFHLGCLRALRDRGVLDRIQVISAVSGGAVIAAMYAYGQQSFAEFDRSVVALLKRGIQGDIARKMLNPAVAARTIGTVALAGSAAVGADLSRVALDSASRILGLRGRKFVKNIRHIQPPLRRRWSTTVAFEAVLRDRAFGNTLITAPRRDDIDIVLNACELRSGSAFRFGNRESGCWRYGVISGNAVEVARAVAASAAYPVLLPAIDDVITFTDRDGTQSNRRVLLTDGGVFDNLGVTCLEPGSAGEVGYNHFAPDYIICCDAGHGLFQDYPIPYLWGPRMARAFESVFRKAGNATQNRLHLFAASGKLKGFVLSYLGQIDKRVPDAPSDPIRREEVFEYPTDFGGMPVTDIERIAKRGEQLTRSLLAYYCPEL